MNSTRGTTRRPGERGQVTLETAIMVFVVFFLFLFSMGVVFILTAHIVAHYAAFAAARCGIVSPRVVRVVNAQGDVDFRGGYRGFEHEAADVVASVMGGMMRYFLPPGHDPGRAVRHRCRAIVQADRAGGAKILRVTAVFRHPVIIPGFHVPGVGDHFPVRATASLPLVKHVARQ